MDTRDVVNIEAAMFHHIFGEEVLARPTLSVKLVLSGEKKCFCFKYKIIDEFSLQNVRCGRKWCD